jgi:hypothetical protein
VHPTGPVQTLFLQVPLSIPGLPPTERVTPALFRQAMTTARRRRPDPNSVRRNSHVPQQP